MDRERYRHSHLPIRWRDDVPGGVRSLDCAEICPSIEAAQAANSGEPAGFDKALPIAHAGMAREPLQRAMRQERG
jgi:hypothetical protein